MRVNNPAILIKAFKTMHQKFGDLSKNTLKRMPKIKPKPKEEKK